MNFAEYLASLQASQLDRLYDSHWTCQAVLRSLPPLAKQYVLRLLFVGPTVDGTRGPKIRARTLREWALPEWSSKHEAAVERLRQLRVLVDSKEGKEGKEGRSFYLHGRFQSQLRKAICGRASTPHRAEDTPPNAPSAADLDCHARKQWESVLLAMVNANTAGGGGSSGGLTPVLYDTFVAAGLLKARGPSDESGGVTEAGFQFLLTDTNEQLWRIVREYVELAERRHMEPSHVISFLMELGFHTVGVPYPVPALSPIQQRIVDDLSSLGLLYLHKAGTQRWYYPTILAKSLSASLSDNATSRPTEGFIIVETNFRIYAHTSSALHVAILRLFIRLEYQLPNLVVGALARDTVMAALDSGLTGDQIVAYLRQHAHPHVAQRVPVVPEAVAEQVRLWEFDRNRVRLTSAVLYENFPSEEILSQVVRKAETLYKLLWTDTSKKRLVVQASAHEDMRNFIKSLGPPKR